MHFDAADARPTKETEMAKTDVRRWETETSFVATFPTNDGEGACDVLVLVGADPDGQWYVRTRDDAGGEDDADDTAYPSREAAEAAAEALAEAADAADGRGAEDYLAAARAEAAEAAETEADPRGEFAVYWDTALDDAGPRRRYLSADAAAAVAAAWNADLAAAHPGGLLCGFEVRRMVDGRWERADD